MGWLDKSATVSRPPAGGAATVMFPELAAAGAPATAAWAGARGSARLRARAGAAGAPFVLLGEGLLRAPPRGRATPPGLSALALEISGPGSPAGIGTPGQGLAGRAWGSPRV